MALGRYVCPVLGCSPPPTAEQTNATRTELTTMWPAENGNSLLQLQSSHNLCRDLQNLSTVGDLPCSEDCMSDLFKRRETPWDTYGACMSESSDKSTKTISYAQFPGAPMNPACKFFDGGGSSWLDDFFRWAMDIGTSASGCNWANPPPIHGRTFSCPLHWRTLEVWRSS